MLWRTSPAATELESVVMRWLARLFGMPDSWTGIIYDTASIAGLRRLAAAREGARIWHSRTRHERPRPPALAHLHHRAHAFAHREGRDCTWHRPAATSFALPATPISDGPARTRGAPSSGILPPACGRRRSSRPSAPLRRHRSIRCREIADVAERFSVWLHVDAAYAGVAAILPEHRNLMDGVDRAHSLVVNPHKWLFVPMDLFGAVLARRG